MFDELMADAGEWERQGDVPGILSPQPPPPLTYLLILSRESILPIRRRQHANPQPVLAPSRPMAP
jgi:hypothetical protein